MKATRLFIGLIGAALVLAGLALGYLWFFCRIYVPPDKMAVLIRKVGQPLPPGQKIAEAGQKGIQRDTLGPGRYFINPWTTEYELHDLIEVPAGNPQTWREVFEAGRPEFQVPRIVGAWPKVGVVTSLVGKLGDSTQRVVEEGYQGILRQVLTPGTYRLNPYAYKVELVDAVVVPLGCVGVVTSQLGEMPGVEVVTETAIGPDGTPVPGERRTIQKLAEPGQRGVLRSVLQPGIYYLNPYVEKVDIVQIGYNQLSQVRGEELYEQIAFPSADGFTIVVDVTVVWGRHPEHTAEMFARMGSVERIREIILSQIRSVCRNIGSDYSSTDFIRGEKREQYQLAVTESLQRVAREKDIEILIALIQSIEVRGGTEEPAGGAQLDLKATIQRGYIAREQELTKQKQRETAEKKAELAAAQAQIEVAREQIRAETRKKVAERLAEGQKQAEEINALRDLEVARIERQIAELDAEKTRVLGNASAQVDQLRNQAEADGKRMLVEAFGSGRAFNLYTFAESFRPESIRLIFAGEGTFWTDLTKLQDAAAMELLRSSTPTPPQK